MEEDCIWGEAFYLSASNIGTMTKGFNTTEKMVRAVHRPGTGTASSTVQAAKERPKFHGVEMIVYGLLILLLATGTYWRKGVWNSELELWTDCV